MRCVPIRKASKPEERILQSGGDKEKAVGVIGASFPNLPGIKNKILAQNRKLHDLASIAQVFQRAAEKFSLCEHGKRASPGEFQGLREGHWFEWLANHAPRRRGRLQFRDNVQAVA